MKKNTYLFLYSLALLIISGVTMIQNWDSESRWKHTFSLIGFIGFAIIFLANIINVIKTGLKK